MKKEDMHNKNQVLHIRSEKEVLSISKNTWVVDLKSSFQVPFTLNPYSLITTLIP